MRKTLGATFHMLVTFCVANVHDTQCGFKLFTRRSAQLLFSNLHIGTARRLLAVLRLASLSGSSLTPLPLLSNDDHREVGV